jgi:hypothetical protein
MTQSMKSVIKFMLTQHQINTFAYATTRGFQTIFPGDGS